MRLRAVLPIVAALALSGCLNGGRGLQPIALQEPAKANEGDMAATIIKAMNGGLVGGAVGQGLSDAEKRRGLEAEYRALEYTPAGEAVAWGESGGRSGFGEVTAAQAYSVGSQNCRQYTQTVTAKGRTQVARGTACRAADGSWTPLT